MQFGEDVEDNALVFGVEVAGRLVGKEDFRFVDECAGDADALLFAAGELFWQVAAAVVKADAFERGQRRCLVGHAVVILRQHDVFAGGEVGQEVELLENEADGAGAESAAGFFVECGGVGAVQKNLSLARGIKAGEDVHQGGFARSA